MSKPDPGGPSRVQIFNEAGTGLVATGLTNDADNDQDFAVYLLQVQPGKSVAVNREYQVQIGAGARVGMLCTAFNDAAMTASFHDPLGVDRPQTLSNCTNNQASHTMQASDETNYSIDFLNNTGETWTLAVYQEMPGTPGLVSVSWKQTTVPHGGESGVQWAISYLACLSNYKQINGKGVYKASQKLPTSLGEKWAIRFEDDAQQLFPDGSTDPGKLLIENQSGDLASPAIGVDGDIALVKDDVYGNNSAQFVAKPTYYVALFKDVTKGEVISGNQIHGPIKVEFAGGKTSLTFEAHLDGPNFVFKEVGSQNAVSCTLDEMAERIEHVERRRFAGA